MKLSLGTALALSALLSHTARADVHCYLFRNDASGVTALTFSYSPPMGNVMTGVAIDPGKTYPFDGRPWCWNLPAGSTALVTVAGSGVPRWTGQLVLGNGSRTADSGTYVMGGDAPPAAAASPSSHVVPATAMTAAASTSAASAAVVGAPASTTATAAAAPSRTCLPNSFPNGTSYCLTALQSGIQLRCDTSHTGRSGSVTIDHLSLTCPGGQSLKLTCMDGLGGHQLCALGDSQICTIEYPRSAAEFCPRKH
jgi:hypothetical protein